MNEKFNFAFNKAAAMAINMHPKFQHYTEAQKHRLVSELHDTMTETDDFIQNPQSYATKLLNKKANEAASSKWTPAGYYEQDAYSGEGIRPRVPVEQMIHPDFREPACYRFARELPEIRKRRAENEALAKVGKVRGAEDAPYEGMPLETMLETMLVVNKELAKLPEHQEYIHSKNNSNLKHN